MAAPNISRGLSVLYQVGLVPGLWLGEPSRDVEAPAAQNFNSEASATTSTTSTVDGPTAHPPQVETLETLESRLRRFEAAAQFLQDMRPETVVDQRLGRLAIVFSGFDSESSEPQREPSKNALLRFHRAGFCSKRDTDGVQQILAFGAMPLDEASIAHRLHHAGSRWPTAIIVSVARYEQATSDLLFPLAQVERRGDEILNPARWVDGTEASKRLGIAAGPELGQALKSLRNAQIEGLVRSKEEALEFIDNYRPDR